MKNKINKKGSFKAIGKSQVHYTYASPEDKIEKLCYLKPINITYFEHGFPNYTDAEYTVVEIVEHPRGRGEHER